MNKAMFQVLDIKGIQPKLGPKSQSASVGAAVNFKCQRKLWIECGEQLLDLRRHHASAASYRRVFDPPYAYESWRSKPAGTWRNESLDQIPGSQSNNRRAFAFQVCSDQLAFDTLNPGHHVAGIWFNNL